MRSAVASWRTVTEPGVRIVSTASGTMRNGRVSVDTVTDPSEKERSGRPWPDRSMVSPRLHRGPA